MAPEKRLSLHEAEDESDDNCQSEGYDSELEVRKGSRPIKRQRLDADDSASASDGESDIDGESSIDALNQSQSSAFPTDQKHDGDQSEVEDDPSNPKIPKLVTNFPDDPTKRRNLVSTVAQIKESGVVYISRIPPFMKPHKLRSLLSPYGAINRTYLAVEDPTSHSRRVKAGGNKKKLFTEGWVEFVHKRDAKRACELLNARTIGGKKGSYYRDDIWSMLYLKGFKWQDLMSQMHKENQERASRMEAELEKSKRENEQFVRNVELGKEIAGMRAKREKKRRRHGEGGTGEGDPATETTAKAASGLEQQQQQQQQSRLARKRRDGDSLPKATRAVLESML